MNDCRTCINGFFTMTNHKPPRINKDFLGFCAAKVVLVLPKFINANEVQRMLYNNHIDPAHAAEGDCKYYVPRVKNPPPQNGESVV